MHHTWLEAVLTVASITSVTSVALLWFLHKRDGHKLAADIRLLREQTRLHSSAAEEPQVPVTSVPEQGAIDRDIRQFVARRLAGWVAATSEERRS